ncbi:hypothetical protein HPB52_006596 [Rhipicephalus sanguineus]|uniref:Uncharacterized protein n=1 Tax=Rhipicephalus sanguineus TaxID=34632 RepID=A0A9D4SXZ9_RHISA|nr:hypothetical protein HPB52_006596 [Rhipicephalus sanguineus]
MVTTVPRLTVYAFPRRMRDFDPNWIRLVSNGGDLDTPVACLLGFIKLFCRADYFKVLQGSDADCLWLEEVKINSAVVRRKLRNVMTGSEPVATMHDVYVLFGVLLCNVNSKEGTIHDQYWFQNRVNELVELFPAVSEQPQVSLYNESQADALSALGEQWPHTAANIVCTIVEGRFQGPMKRLQEYVCTQWSIAEMIGVVPQPLQSATSEPPVLQQSVNISRPSNPLLSAAQELAISDTPVMQETRSNPAVQGQRRGATSIAPTMLQLWDASRSMPTVMATQKVFVFPPQGEFDPKWIRLLTKSRDPDTAVACLLGFIELVCGADFQKVLNSADKDGLELEPVIVSSAEVRQQLNHLMTDSEPSATIDDFYVLLGVLLCNLSCPRGYGTNRGWFRTRADDLIELFPHVSYEVPVRLYDDAQADAIRAFGERWPQTRAAICSIILMGQFKGPMQILQQYVSESWSFAGMEHAERILEFLIIRYPWVVDVIPELKSKDHILQEFLQVYKRLRADAPYMKLLHLPEAAKALRGPLALHAAAAYALAVVEDWSQYTGLPDDRAEEEVYVKVSTMVQLGLRAPPVEPDASSTVPVELILLIAAVQS